MAQVELILLDFLRMQRRRSGPRFALRAQTNRNWASSLYVRCCLLLREDLLHPTHFARLKANLDSVGMSRRLRQDGVHHASCRLTRSPPPPPPCPPPSPRGRESPEEFEEFGSSGDAVRNSAPELSD